MDVSMIWVDWILLAALIASILIGVLRGFTREVLGLVTWILSIAATLLLAPSATGYLESQIPTPSLRIAAAYALVFFGGLVIGAIITAIIVKLVRQSPLSGVDRAVGAGFGLVRGLLLAVVTVWLVGMTPARKDPWWGQSTLIPRLEVLTGLFERFMPEKWRSVPALPAVVKEGI
jgi:membrane protein required for colicin V production